jgi:tetratricopeptide (TPR) repeat protein
MQAGAPEKETGYMSEARLRFAQKDYDAALDIANEMLEKNPHSVPVLLLKVDVLAAKKQFDEAMPVAEKLQQVLPDGGQGYYLKGKLLQQQGETADAIEQYELALQKTPGSVEVLTALIRLEASQNGGDRAEKRLLAMLEENPEHRSANGLLGAVYLSKKDFAEAEKTFQRQLELTPESAVVYAQLAQTRFAQGNLDSAEATYRQGLKVLPDNPQLLIGLAGMQERQQDYEAAIATYEKLLEQLPDNAIGINNLTALLTDHRSDAASLDKAAEMAAKLEKTEQPAFMDTAGWVYYRKGEFARAADILKGVVEQAPQVPVFQYHLGMAYLKLGDKAAAIEHLTRATDGDFSYQGVEEARAALKDL